MSPKFKTRNHVRLLAALMILAGSGSGAALAESGKPDKLFESDTNLEITLSAPWERFMDEKDNEEPYAAVIEYTDSNGESRRHDATVARRGITRQRVCEFPPIELRVEKEDVKDSTLRGQKKLKLVTHCRRSERYDQYYLLEMMAYRMFNVVTDFSFRVRPLTVTYRDSENGETHDSRFAFLIEDDSDAAKRNDMKKLDIGRIPLGRLEPGYAADVALFQYMIGNVDWSPLIGPDAGDCCHNMAPIAPKPLGEDNHIWPLPYDFDSSGLVDAPYAEPPASVDARSVTERVYRGYCAHNEALGGARSKALERKDDIVAVLDSDPRLSERSRKKTGKYLEKYFDILEDDRDFERRIVRNCRK